MNGRDQRQTFLCLVCFENQDLDERFEISACREPDHGCCKACAASFLRSRIEDGRVFELVCPVGAAGSGCGLAGGGKEAATATRGEVEQCLVDDEVTLAKFSRFVKAKNDPSLRECPDCQHLCRPALDPSGQPQPEMCCNGCGAEFCYYHAAAHRNGSCEDYEMWLVAETKNIGAMFGAKSCPSCTRQTLKSGGCNHMTCQVCRCDWCWACGEQLATRGPSGEDPIYWHYTDDNVDSGCRQFAEVGSQHDPDEVRRRRRHRRPGHCVRSLCAPVAFISVTFLVLIFGFVVTLWLFCFCTISMTARMTRRACGTGCCTWQQEGTAEVTPGKAELRVMQATMCFALFTGLVIFLVPFSAIFLVWAVLVFPLWFCHALLTCIPWVRSLVPTTNCSHLKYVITMPVRAVCQTGFRWLAHIALSRRDNRPGNVP